ncbi:hypothetical protein DSO57_1022423 [Entomophthora muscae]|uniref:Uncharacterized protein n=1 Tax=Entomophthora muscae TaxID=34485 RepID=A0ACC2S591_9FUNG|nr:hypothetical protein DSO57_1022423 [Entomophthora muscae]
MSASVPETAPTSDAESAPVTDPSPAASGPTLSLTDKLEQLMSLYVNSYNLIFLSKTWFIDFAVMQNHPDFIINTIIVILQTCIFKVTPLF